MKVDIKGTIKKKEQRKEEEFAPLRPPFPHPLLWDEVAKIQCSLDVYPWSVPKNGINQPQNCGDSEKVYLNSAKEENFGEDECDEKVVLAVNPVWAQAVAARRKRQRLKTDA